MSALRLNSQAPLLFLRPVGFDAAETMAIAGHLQTLDSAQARWRLPPPGVPADAYIAHVRCLIQSTASLETPSTQTSDALAIGQSQDDFSPGESRFVGTQHAPYKRSRAQAFDTAPSAEQTQTDMLSTFSGSTHALAGLHLDPQYLTMEPQPYYRGVPLCLVGSEMDTHDTWAQFGASAQADLQTALAETEPLIDHLRIAYRLGEIALDHVKLWSSKQILVGDGPMVLAAIQARDWQVYLSPEASSQNLDQASVRAISNQPAFEPHGHEQLPLESVLWVFVQRCEEKTLERIAPPELFKQRLTLRRPPLLSNAQMGRQCSSILRRLEIQPMTADELQAMLRLSRPALERAIVSLAATRVIAPESQGFEGPAWISRFKDWFISSKNSVKSSAKAGDKSPNKSLNAHRK